MKAMHGIITVTITPFKDNGELDYGAAAAHIDWLIKSGVHGLLPLGATGEFAALSMAERKEYAEFFVKHVAGRVPVMIGAVSMNLKETLELSAHAASINADAVMALPAPGLHLSQREIYEYYRMISEQVTLPVMIYNNPGSSGVDIEPETLKKVAALKHMSYLKESTGDIKRLTGSVDSLEKALTIFCGCENLAYESLMMGAKGWISVAGNVAPAMCARLYDCLKQEGGFAEARAIYRTLLPLLRLIEETGELWQVVKYAAHKQGFGNGMPRQPRLPISDMVKSEVDKVMSAAALH